ncbi:putative serine threonine-protein kinase tsuA-like protein, partial [Trifolium pratense]
SCKCRVPNSVSCAATEATSCHVTTDNSLYYVGGDTRIVAVDRHSSLTHLCSHLSRNLLHGRRSFTLKYHLPDEDLDNLITVSTDEDLQNMIEEYDRLSSNPSPPLLDSDCSSFSPNQKLLFLWTLSIMTGPYESIG